MRRGRREAVVGMVGSKRMKDVSENSTFWIFHGGLAGHCATRTLRVPNANCGHASQATPLMVTPQD